MTLQTQTDSRKVNMANAPAHLSGFGRTLDGYLLAMCPRQQALAAGLPCVGPCRAVSVCPTCWTVGPHTEPPPCGCGRSEG